MISYFKNAEKPRIACPQETNDQQKRSVNLANCFDECTLKRKLCSKQLSTLFYFLNMAKLYGQNCVNLKRLI